MPRTYAPTDQDEPVCAAPVSNRSVKLAALRRMIQSVSPDRPVLGSGRKAGPGTVSTGWKTGVACIDASLPQAGLQRDGLHEISAASYGDSCAAVGFGLALLSQLRKAGQNKHGLPVLWCQNAQNRREFGPVYAHGLAALGLAPGDVIFAAINRAIDLLWAAEEGLRSGCLAAVIAETNTVSFTHTRRLCLAAAQGKTAGLLIQPHGLNHASAAHSRWRIARLPGGTDPYDTRAPLTARWRAELHRCRGGRRGEWALEWLHETHRFRLAAATAARPDLPAAKPAVLRLAI